VILVKIKCILVDKSKGVIKISIAWECSYKKGGYETQYSKINIFFVGARIQEGPII